MVMKKRWLLGIDFSVSNKWSAKPAEVCGGRILLARGSGGSCTVCSGTGTCGSFSVTKSLIVEVTTPGREFGFQEGTRGLRLVMGRI